MILSPAVMRFHETLRPSENKSVDEDAVENLCEILQSVKHQRNDSARTTMTVLKSAISGENINEKRAVTNLAKRLGIKPASLKAGARKRTKIMHSEKSSFQYTERKTRTDKIKLEDKQTAYEYWLSPENSRVSNNKNDIKRVRLGPRIFASHQMYILEKTQTEVYMQFQRDHPDVKIGQRAFEKCKPHFVRSATMKDKVTCCCRQHVEIRSVFKTCNQYQKKIISEKRASGLKQYDSLNALVEDTLCPRSANTHQHKLSCLNRECKDCGTKNVCMVPQGFEMENDIVQWEKYEYKNVKIKGDKEIKKLMLVKKSTDPSEMFSYFRYLLESFPAHQFRAQWQNKQLKSLIQNLPQDHCVCIHDFSENYKCGEKVELQSSFFAKMEVSLHVTILHRHAVLEYDGIESTSDEPQTITEQFFVISPDPSHDHHFTHTVQSLITEYLNSISLNVSTMHEFTDGCSCQYKSRHCLGDISFACQDFGYERVIRNFFETSHARGPQDAAGGFIKKQTDLAVIRGNCIIQNAYDVYQFASSHLTTTSTDAKCVRRIFRYVTNVERDRDRYFVPVKDNRKIHQVISSYDEPGKIKTRNLSCYTCQQCITGNYDFCENDHQIGSKRPITLSKQSGAVAALNNDELEEEQMEIKDLVNSGNIIALRAEDEKYPYYLLKATSSSQVITSCKKDKWGQEFSAGSEVVTGFYYDQIDKTNPFRLRLLKRIPAVVPSRSVVYICSELNTNEDILDISEYLHRRILKSIE